MINQYNNKLLMDEARLLEALSTVNDINMDIEMFQIHDFLRTQTIYGVKSHIKKQIIKHGLIEFECFGKEPTIIVKLDNGGTLYLKSISLLHNILCVILIAKYTVTYKTCIFVNNKIILNL